MIALLKKNKILWLCYGITIVVFRAVYWLVVRTGDITSITSSFYMKIIPSFIIALILGTQNSFLKWLYPISTIVLAFLSYAQHQVDRLLHHNYLHFMGIRMRDLSSDLSIVIFFLFVPLLGLGIGSIFKLLIFDMHRIK